MSAVTKRGPADRDDQDVGAARDRGQVARARVTIVTVALRMQREQRNRLADDVGAADDHDLLALEADP
jgi:hypothetical protein